MLPVKVQIKFTKTLLGVNKQAVNLAVLGEIGMYPISIHAFKSAIGLTHVSKSLRWVEILYFSDIKSCLTQNKDLVAFLHNSSTAFVKIPKGLKIIPKYL
jgi:hypothetical protein